MAIKKVPNAFNDLTDALRILREIRLMRHFNHENIVRWVTRSAQAVDVTAALTPRFDSCIAAPFCLCSIYDLGPPLSPEVFEDVYIMSELMETDLHRIIYSRQDLSDDHLQYFLYQILVSEKNDRAHAPSQRLR